MCHFRTAPQPTICWRGLQGCCEFLLELGRKQWTAHIDLMATITYSGFSLRIPAPNHGAHPPGCVAKLLSYHLWRFALHSPPQNVEVGFAPPHLSPADIAHATLLLCSLFGF